jgi:hypothetical protein
MEILSLLTKNDDDKVNKKIVEIRINRNQMLNQSRHCGYLGPVRKCARKTCSHCFPAKILQLNRDAGCIRFIHVSRPPDSNSRVSVGFDLY